MVAPSQHVSGRHYEWKYLPTANDKFPQLPTALLTAINGPSTNGTKPPLDLASIFDGVPEGQRDEKLFRALCKIRSQNLPKDFALEYALKAAANCQPPFPERLVVEKVERVYSKPEYAPAPRDGNGKQEEPKHEQSSQDDSTPRVETLGDLWTKDIPARESFLGDGLIARGDLIVFSGPQKKGKSLVGFE